MCRAEAPFKLRSEIILIVGGVVELVFVLNIHRAGVAAFRQYGEKALPIDRALTRNPPTATTWHYSAD